MMHNAWCSIEEVPYCFPRSSVKCQGHMGQKTSILTQIGRFRTVNLVWIHWWLWNDAQSLKQHRRGALLFFKVIRHILSSHDKKSPILTRISRAFSDCKSSLNWPMDLKWCTKMYYGNGALSFFVVIHQIARSHGQKNGWFGSIWAILLGWSQLSNPSDLPCSRLSVKFKVTQLKNRLLTQIGRFLTVTLVWIHPRL